MPEGDTVWNTARVLHRALAGRTLTASDFRVPQLATTELAGWTVRESACRGKHLLLRLTDGLRLTDRAGRGLTVHSHLRMDGAWRVYRPDERWTARPAHLIRVVLRTADTVAVGYHLHDVAIVATDDEETVVGHLGPDLLGPDWDAAEATRRLAAHPNTTIAEALLDQTNLAGIGPDFCTNTPMDALAATAAGFWVPDEAVRRLRREPERTIGVALLDQRSVAGIGTIYRAETLFLRGVHPWTPVHQVAGLDGLLLLARRLMIANRERHGQVTTGDMRRGHQRWVYGRAGERCRRCGTRVDRGSQGPVAEERVIYWCPACQPSAGG